MTLAPDFRLLTLADVEPAAVVLAEAFVDDPLCVYMLPHPKTRASTLLTFFRILGAVSIKNQRAYGAGEPLLAVAYWQRPEADSVSISLKSLGKLLPLLFSPYALGFVRARPILNRIDQLHARHAAAPHFYLDNLGVRPAARGRGLSSRLIRPFLEEADRQQVMSYTDTVTRANVALYEHFGFECVEESPVAGMGVTVWALRRPAQAAA